MANKGEKLQSFTDFLLNVYRAADFLTPVNQDSVHVVGRRVVILAVNVDGQNWIACGHSSGCDAHLKLAVSSLKFFTVRNPDECI
jgi:hypothetical protein